MEARGMGAHAGTLDPWRHVLSLTHSQSSPELRLLTPDSTSPIPHSHHVPEAPGPCSACRWVCAPCHLLFSFSLIFGGDPRSSTLGRPHDLLWQ